MKSDTPSSGTASTPFYNVRENLIIDHIMIGILMSMTSQDKLETLMDGHDGKRSFFVIEGANSINKPKLFHPGPLIGSNDFQTLRTYSGIEALKGVKMVTLQ